MPLIRANTWELVPHLSKMNVVTCHWVFTFKYDPGGSSHHPKARPIAHCFMQAFKVNYIEIFSPMICLNWV